LRTPVNFIVHDLDDVNEQLTRGRYFFTDIVRDGVVLFEEPGSAFIEPTALTPRQALEESRKYFDEGMNGASYSRQRADNSIRDNQLKYAAFDLHQTAEQLYTCLLLVVSLYTPKSHNLIRLRGLAEPFDPRLVEVWPTDTKFHKRCFELLRAAYVKARYSPHYKVTAEELAWIQERIELLQSLVKELCEARLRQLGEDAAT
jgi:hypothetical protein